MIVATVRDYLRDYRERLRVHREPPCVPFSEHAREMNLRLSFEVRYWLLMKKTGRKVTTDEARAWLLDQSHGGRLVEEMHAALMPEGYQPLTRGERDDRLRQSRQ
jgi:hypothetical protein